MTMPFYTKDPGAILDYGFDWTKWLADGETISDSTWVVQSGITNVDDGFTDTVTAIWLSGGTHGESYKVTNHITTSDTREDERSMVIYVKNR